MMYKKSENSLKNAKAKCLCKNVSSLHFLSQRTKCLCWWNKRKLTKFAFQSKTAKNTKNTSKQFRGQKTSCSKPILIWKEKSYKRVETIVLLVSIKWTVYWQLWRIYTAASERLTGIKLYYTDAKRRYNSWFTSRVRETTKSDTLLFTILRPSRYLQQYIHLVCSIKSIKSTIRRIRGVICICFIERNPLAIEWWMKGNANVRLLDKFIKYVYT